jgi:hypothetical protein
MTTPSDESPDDGFWRRPAEPPAGTPTSPPRTAGPPPEVGSPPPVYPGPPPSAPPPPEWRPPVHLQAPPPRQLPAQDLPALDAQEASARTMTYGIGLIAGAVLLVVVCVLCSRLFS